MENVEFLDVVEFHGHICPGLSMGFRVAKLAIQKLALDPKKEDLLTIAENNSCAVDAIQVMTGCTYGKGNLVINNFGKQVYTIVRRPKGEGIRIAAQWKPPPESKALEEVWKKYMAGDRTSDVVQAVNGRKTHKARLILEADEEELFKTSFLTISLPERAKIYPTVTCQKCSEKIMGPKAIKTSDGIMLCIPCSEKNN